MFIIHKSPWYWNQMCKLCEISDLHRSASLGNRLWSSEICCRVDYWEAPFGASRGSKKAKFGIVESLKYRAAGYPAAGFTFSYVSSQGEGRTSYLHWSVIGWWLLPEDMTLGEGKGSSHKGINLWRLSSWQSQRQGEWAPTSKGNQDSTLQLHWSRPPRYSNSLFQMLCFLYLTARIPSILNGLFQ